MGTKPTADKRSGKSPSVKLQCQECGKVISRKGAKTFYTCPRCGGVDLDLA